MIVPALGACHIGLNAGVDAAICWVAAHTVCIAHGTFVSWCDEHLTEQRRLILPRHVKSIAAFSDGGLVICLEETGVWVVSADGRLLREFDVHAPSRVFARRGSTSEQADFAVVRSVRDQEHGFEYSVAERYSADQPEGALYGTPGSFASNLSTAPDVSPELGVAIAREWWGIRVRPLVGAAAELKRDGFQSFCFVDEAHVLLGGRAGIQRVRLSDGEVLGHVELANQDVRLNRSGPHFVARVDRKRLVVLNHHLEVLADRDFGAGLSGGAPSPSLESWVLAYCPDDVSPRQLAWVGGSGKPKKQKRLLLENHSIAVDDEALYLGAPKNVARLTPSGLQARDLGVGTPHLLARFKDQLVALGGKLTVAEAASLLSKGEAKVRYSQTHSGIWSGVETLVATSGARRVKLEGQLTEHKLRSPCKHVLATVIDGEDCYVDNQGWVRRGKREPIQLLKLAEDEWYPSAVSRDGQTWAVDWKSRGLRAWKNAGKSALNNIPAETGHDVISLAFDSEGTRLLVGRIGMLQVVDLVKGETQKLELPGQCLSVAFSASGGSVFTVLHTHLFGTLGELVEGEVRCFDAHDLSQRFRLFLAKDAALLIGPDGQTECIGKASVAAQLAMRVNDLEVSAISPGSSGSLLEAALR